MGSGQAQLDISVIEARNIPPKSKAGTCNVYVRFRIGEGFFSWSNSNRVPKVPNPKWDFVTTLKVKERSPSRILYAKVMESKFLSKDESIGECVVDLDTLPHNEAQDMWIPLNTFNNNSVELHLCVTYYPLGRVYLPHSISPILPTQISFLAAISPDTVASPPSSHLKIHSPALVSENGNTNTSSASLTPEQLRAEDLYTQAIQVLKEGLFIKSSDQIRKASDMLAESLKVYRLGKSYAMLAYIFYLFDCPELVSKYLSFAEKLDATFPVIAQLRKVLIEEACGRKELDTPTDRLSIVVVGATGLSALQMYIGQEIYCKICVGFFEEERDSSLCSVILDNDYSVMWREFFEISLTKTKAAERYKFANQFCKIQLYTKTAENSTLIAETRPLDLFTFIRDTVVDRWVHLVPQGVNQIVQDVRAQPMIRIIFNYQMGTVTEEEAAELLYSAIYCKDRAMTESLTRKKITNINACFKEFPYSTSKDLEPQYSTPLTKAARFGHKRMIRELVELGADVNGRDKDGFTALMRALQYDRLYNNTRAIKLLLSLGADTEMENSKGINCYGYSKSNDIWLYLKSLKPTPLYRFTVVICSSCKFVQIPSCTEHGEPCLQVDDCKCPVPQVCSFCSLPLSGDSVGRWLSSKNEIGSVHNAFLPRLPDTLKCCLVQCKCCTSFGFAATESAQGLQLCKVEGDDIICTKHASDETMVYPLKTSGPLWMIAHHWKGCYLPSSSMISPVTLSKQQTVAIGSMLARTPTWVHDPTPPPFQLEQLPGELLQLVLLHLSCEDLAAVESVSHYLRAVSRDEVLWKSKFSQDFFITERGVACPKDIVASLPLPELFASSPALDFSWKDLYVDYHMLYYWIRDLLLDETFNFKYDTRICSGNGHVFVDLKLIGKKYIFNLDGDPFSFDNDFTITLEFASIGCMVSATIIATGQPAEKVITLNASGQLSLPKNSNINMEIIRAHTGRVSLRLPLQETALSRWVNPYLAVMVPGYQSFMQLKDNVGGSVVLDLFYYTIDSVILEDSIAR